MNELTRFGVSVENDLLTQFDELIGAQGYGNRSEALRDLMRDALVRSRVESPAAGNDIAVGTLTIVYDHHARELPDKLANLQHGFHEIILSVLHLHLSHDECLEISALRGTAERLQGLANDTLSLKGVKHGKLFLTLPHNAIIGKKSTRRHSHKH